jgi:SAM-dependent methyltransferase
MLVACSTRMRSSTRALPPARSPNRPLAEVQPASFYTGLVADLYAPLKSVSFDPEPYARFIAASGEPALELGCGDGEPLLDLRARGLDVDGLDSSPDMLERCRRAAARRGLQVVLHHQPMESMALPRRYRSIFLAGPTFNLLPDDDTASRALARIRAHLVDDGSALVPLFIPVVTPAAQLGQAREARAPDDSLLRVTAVSESRDEVDRRQTTVLRYERVDRDTTATVERPWILHWHTQAGFRALAASAGLTTNAVLDADGARAAEADQAFAFVLTPSRAVSRASR